MSAEEMVVSPDGYKTKGGVPRGILIAIVLGLTVVAMGLFLATSGPKQAVAPDVAVQKKLADPASVQAQVAGKPATVDEIADDAERKALAAKRKAESEAEALRKPEPGLGADRAPLPKLQGNGGPVRGGQAVGTETAEDQGRVASEMSARSSQATVFDEGGGSSAMTGVKDAVRNLTGSKLASDGVDALRAATEAAIGSQGNAMTDLTEAMKASLGQPSKPSKAADSNVQWASAQAATGGGKLPEVLRPNPPAANLMLTEGTVIPALTTRQINSDLPGVVTARVMVDVYDSRTSVKLLLPKGALLTGRYNNSVDFGQERLQVAFTRLRMPDGSTYELPGAGGSDAAGRAGLSGDVNRHYLRVYGSALLIGMLADKAVKVAAIPQSANGTGQLSATGQAMVDIVKTELDRLKATPVTITIPEGSRINVEVIRDMVFPSVYKQQGF